MREETVGMTPPHLGHRFGSLGPDPFAKAAQEKEIRDAQPFTFEERLLMVKAAAPEGELDIRWRRDIARYEATLAAVEAERDALQAELDEIRETARDLAFEQDLLN